MVRRLPQLGAGLAALALLGTAVGAEATIGSPAPALVAVPAAQVVAPAVEAPAGQVAADSLSVAEVTRAARERAAAERLEAAEDAAEKKKAEEKKAKAAKAEAEAKAKAKGQAEAEERAEAEEQAAAQEQAEAKEQAEAEAAAKERAEKEAEADEAAAVAAREQRASREGERVALDASRLGDGAGSRWTTVALNARTAPDADAALVDVLDAGDEVSITERSSGTWRQIELGGRAAWVAAEYLADAAPKAPAAASSGGSERSGGSGASGGAGSGGSGGACPSGSSVEAGLQPNAVAVHRAICAAFPSITSYGGVRADSVPGHPDGRAIDAMIPNYSGSGNALGWQVAEHVRANASRLGVTEVIFDQKIWTTQRSGEGWRTMSNRGGDTANHRDHVHVTVR